MMLFETQFFPLFFLGEDCEEYEVLWCWLRLNSFSSFFVGEDYERGLW